VVSSSAEGESGWDWESRVWGDEIRFFDHSFVGAPAFEKHLESVSQEARVDKRMGEGEGILGDGVRGPIPELPDGGETKGIFRGCRVGRRKKSCQVTLSAAERYINHQTAVDYPPLESKIAWRGGVG
jgi:hypothetical protein